MEGVTERVGNEIRPSGVSVCFSSLVNCLQVHSLRNNSVCLAAGLGLLIMTMNGCMCFICTFGFFSDKHAHTQVEIHTFPSMLCSFCVPHCVHSTQTNGRERERERERAHISEHISYILHWQTKNPCVYTQSHHLQLTLHLGERWRNRMANNLLLLLCGTLKEREKERELFM